MYFRNVTGQDALKRQLTETARRGAVPHARLFCGQDGTGAFQLALAYARYLNCTRRSDDDACGRCPSCLKFNRLAHPDLHFVFPVVKDRKREVCDDYLEPWRAFVNEKAAAGEYFDIHSWLAYIKSEGKQATIYEAESEKIIHKMNLRIYEADYRILFVWMPERMHPACSNKLLKIIEEPPDNTAILMITGSPDTVLGTIVSRSQTVDVRPIEQYILTQELVNRYGMEVDEARLLAHLAGGNLLKAAEQLSADGDNAYFLEKYILMMRNGWARDVARMKQFADETATLGRERQKNFLAYCQRQTRENFVKRFGEPSINFFSGGEADFAAKFSPFVNERNVVDMMEEFALAENHIGRNSNAKMVFFDLSMRITALLKR
jgi:DNA polymerase-3 subunit delta'